MIYDSLENAALYEGVHPGFAAAFDFLRRAMKEPPAPGRCEISGSDVYANVMECDTKPAQQQPWEAHRKYIDIQFLLQGEEEVGFADLSCLENPSPYDETRDFLPAPAAAQRGSCILTAGRFCILFPQDAHQPNCNGAAPSHNKKIVVKVRV